MVTILPAPLSSLVRCRRVYLAPLMFLIFDNEKIPIFKIDDRRNFGNFFVLGSTMFSY